MNRLEFTLPDVGLREIEGLTWVEDGFLVIQLSNKLIGLVDEERDLIKVEPTALSEIRLQKRPFKDRLILVPKRRDLLDAIPGNHANDVRLRIWRTKRSQTEQLVIDVKAMQQYARLSKKSNTSPGESTD